MIRSTFTKAERLKRSVSIQTVFRKGKKYNCSGAKLFVLASEFGRNRIVFTFPRGFGNAVQRNHSRRISREVYRLIKKHIKVGFDISILIYPGNDDFRSRNTQFECLFQKANLWID